MGVFDNIEKARTSGGGVYLGAGAYELEHLIVTVGQTRPPKSYAFLAVHFKVLGSNNPAHKIGDEVDWFIGADKDAFLSNAKEWAKAVLQSSVPEGGEPIDEATITSAVLEELTDKNGEAVRGQVLRVNVVPKPIKSKPGSFYSRHYWLPTAQPAV